MDSKLRRVLLYLAGTAVALALAAPARAQSGVFFSEYIEGSSNNKALEIFNNTGASVNLGADGYSVQMFFNGNPSAGLTINLTGTVAAGDVYVIAHSLANATILAQADQTNGAGWFNGDDAVVLRQGTTVLDVIGQIGFDPGTEWGSGIASTADNTLRRSCTIAVGDPDGSNVFDPGTEWGGFATNDAEGLGAHCGSTPPPPPPPPPAPLVAIHEIQGSGAASPYAGQRVETQGNVVTAAGASGFFIQSTAPDADVSTSEGIFVFTGSAPAASVGDVVNVTGTVVEFFDMTEFSGGVTVTIVGSGAALPAPVEFDAFTPSPSWILSVPELERYEGMLVRAGNGMTSAPTDRFGETAVTAGGTRAYREPGILYPGLPGLEVWDGNPEVFEIDFDTLGSSPGRLYAGTPISVAGPLAFSFGDYQIWPTSFSAGVAPALPRAVRADAAGEFTIGSQNLLRLMDTVNDPGGDDVLTPEEYATKLEKAARHIREVLAAPDVVAVQEVEKLAVLEDLAIEIAAQDPALHYAAHLLEGNDVGGIDVGFLVRDGIRVDSIQQFGAADLFTFNGQTSLLNDRPPLVLRGAYTGNGEPFPFVLINVHQRSLSGIDGTDGARVRAKRHAQASGLAEFIQGLQQAEPAVRLAIVGDFNAFEFSDGYVDVMGIVTGLLDPDGALVPGADVVNPDLVNQTLNMPAAERYSFVFDGSAQSLDHVLTSQGLLPFVRGAGHSRGNADAYEALAADAGTPLRVADHDGTVLFVMTDRDADAAPDDLDNCPAFPNPGQSDIDGDGIGDACDQPVDKNECKDDGWQIFASLAFPNQGQCVAFVEARRPW